MPAGEGFNISKVMYDALIGCLVLLELIFMKMLSDLRSTDEKLFDKYISLGATPAPDLLIRTSGEKRISNFLIWSLAYSELYFTSCFWPEFNKEQLHKAIKAYSQRDRRFGAVQ